MKLNIVFMGTPAFALEPLYALMQHHSVVGVFSQPPKRANRGQKIVKSPVHVAAEAAGIPVFCPESFDGAYVESVQALKPDIIIVVAYGLLLPKSVLTLPRYGCINIHASLLPAYRGASPIQQSILAGCEVTGVSLMVMDEGMDTGPVLVSETTDITGDMYAQDVSEKLSSMGARLLLHTLPMYARGDLEPLPQSTKGISYAPKIKKSSGLIQWSNSAEFIYRQIRALREWPGVYFIYGDKRIKVLSARINSCTAPLAPVGTVLDDTLSIQCGEGILLPTLLQKEGRRSMRVEDFLRGCPLPKGSSLC